MPNPNISENLQLRLHGSPSQSINGNEVVKFRSTKTQALLYYLAVTGETHRRASLAALFWPNVSEKKANASLRVALNSLRKVIPDQLIVDRNTVALDFNLVWVDTQQFMLLLQETDDPTLTMQQRQTAVSLYAGDFLEGFHVDDAPDFDHWVTSMREHFQQGLIHALMDLARWYAARRDLLTSRSTLSRLLMLAPGNEAAHRLMMQVLANTGQRAAAILQFDTCRRYLAEELGVDPEPETMALYEQLLEGKTVDAVAEAAMTTMAHAPPSPQSEPERDHRIDWGDMPGRTPFYGRQQQLTVLTERLVRERAAMVVVSGMGGVGKTALAAELVYRLADSPAAQTGFTRIIWRSLINAPALKTLLDDWLHAVVQSPVEQLPESLDAKLELLFAELDRQRFLLVLDNVESIIATGPRAGEFRDGFDDYRRLLERMAHGHHQSCLLITTRVVPRGIRRLEHDYLQVYHLPLEGLSLDEGMVLLRHRAIKGATNAFHHLINHYSGNPLALKLVASAVNDLYAGDIETFLREGASIFDDVRDVLDQQFERLDTLARDLLIWMAINREPIAFDELGYDLLVQPTRRKLIEAIHAIRRASLLLEVAPNSVATAANEMADPRLALHNVMIEYLTDRILDTCREELAKGEQDYFHRYTLRKAGAPEYVQTIQTQLFLAPLAQWLVSHAGASGAREQLRTLLDNARQDAKLAKGYTGTNIIHLMLQLSPELQGEDFSGLSLRQADFRTANLMGVDLRNTELAATRFADGFGIVLAVAVSPDGQFLAVGAGQVVGVWWLQTLKPHTIFEGHPRDVSSIAFSPDGRVLASASFDGTIIIWNAATVEKVNRFKSTVGDVISIAFSPDGETLVCGGYNGRIGVWDWSRGEKLGLLALEERILRLAFASTGELLVNIGYRGVVQAWDIAGQKVIYSLHNDNESYVANSALAVGRSLFWTNQGEVINGWDWRKREFFCELRGLQVSIEGLALSPDEEQLASAHADGTIILWDLRHRQPLRFLTGHQGSVRTLAYTPDGHHLISGGYDETVRIWGVQTGLEEKRLQGHFHFVHILRFSPNGESLAGVSLTSLAYLWRGPDLNALQTLQGHKSAIRTVAFSPDGRLLVTGSDDGRVKIWDVQASALRYAFSAHADHVWTVAFDHSGGYLASSGLDKTICLWDVASGHLLQTIPLSGANTMDGFAFHPRYALLTYCDTDNHIYIWEVETGRVVASAAVASQPKVVAYSPDGRYLACGAYDGSITMWALMKHSTGVTLSQCWRLQPSTQCVWGVVFSPDGSLLAWNGEQRDIYVASIAEGAVLYSINGTHLARCIAFSADGQRLLTDGSGLDLCVYDALTGEVHQPLKGHTANLTSIVSSPTSSTVASSDASGVVKLWDLATGRALATTQLNGPYLGMNITGATGLTQGQRQALLALGAVDEP